MGPAPRVSHGACVDCWSSKPVSTTCVLVGQVLYFDLLSHEVEVRLVALCENLEENPFKSPYSPVACPCGWAADVIPAQQPSILEDKRHLKITLQMQVQIG